MSRSHSLLAIVQILALLIVSNTHAFSVCPLTTTTTPTVRTPTSSLNSFFGGNKQDDDEDLSYIETRDMTREEMQEYNRRFEDTVNQEIVGMTVFSLIISLPLLYLAWVGLFAETAEIASDFSDLPYN